MENTVCHVCLNLANVLESSKRLSGLQKRWLVENHRQQSHRLHLLGMHLNNLEDRHIGPRKVEIGQRIGLSSNIVCLRLSRQ